jgi:hypothetical protein
MMASYLSVDPGRVHDLHIVQSVAEIWAEVGLAKAAYRIFRLVGFTCVHPQSNRRMSNDQNQNV